MMLMMWVGVRTRECGTDSTTTLCDGGKDHVLSLFLYLNSTCSVLNGFHLLYQLEQLKD